MTGSSPSTSLLSEFFRRSRRNIGLLADAPPVTGARHQEETPWVRFEQNRKVPHSSPDRYPASRQLDRYGAGARTRPIPQESDP